MNDTMIARIPMENENIKEASTVLTFTMASGLYTGSLLKTLAGFLNQVLVQDWQQPG